MRTEHVDRSRHHQATNASSRSASSFSARFDARVELPERLEHDAALLELPRSGDEAVDEDRRVHEAVVRDDPRRRDVAEDPRAVRVREDEIVETRHEPRRSRRLRVGQRRSREVVEHLPAPRRERPQRQPLERLGDRLHPGHARPLADVLFRRRPVGGEIGADELVERLLRRAVARPAPSLPRPCTRRARRSPRSRRAARGSRTSGSERGARERSAARLRLRVRLEQRTHLLEGQLVDPRAPRAASAASSAIRAAGRRASYDGGQSDAGELPPHGHDRPVVPRRRRRAACRAGAAPSRAGARSALSSARRARIPRAVSRARGTGSASIAPAGRRAARPP